MRVTPAVLVLVAAAWSPTHAQRFRGVVRDSATQEPVGGALVTVTDSAGRFLSRGVANAVGQFSVYRLDGSAKLSIVRIGYEPRSIPAGASDTAMVVLMRQLPALLAAVTQSSTRVCPADSGESFALTLWEQARAALLASVVARESNAPTVDLMSTTREREPVRRRIVDDARETKTVVGDKPYVAARPASAFAEDGYMIEDLGGARSYFAPDEDVLLHESFVATHCLHVVDGKGEHSGDVGIGFEPVDLDGRDTLVDIRGTLWIDRSKPALRSLDFQYTGLEPAANGSGGQIEFETMPTGTSIIRKWTISFAVVAYDAPVDVHGVRRNPPARSRRTSVRVLGFRETSGEVGAAVWPDGTKWRGSLPRFVGRVVDTTGKPAPGAIVLIAGWARSRDTVVAGKDGRFVSPFILGGAYALFAVESVFVHTGLVGTQPFSGRAVGADTQVELSLPPRRNMLRAVCAGQEYQRGTGVIIGRATAPDGSPEEGLRVEASWFDSTTERDASKRVDTRADGQFVICGVGLNRRVRVHALTRHEIADVMVDVGADDVIPVPLPLKPRP